MLDLSLIMPMEGEMSPELAFWHISILLTVINLLLLCSSVIDLSMTYFYM